MSSTRNVSTIDYFDAVKSYLHSLRADFDEDLLYAEEQIQIQQSIPILLDKAVVQIKSKNQTILKMQKQMKDLMGQNKRLLDFKNDYHNAQRKNTQKAEEINILRDTIKTLYEQNEKLITDKNQLSKQIATIKQTLAALKKKHKRQEQQLLASKADIKKSTQMAQERLNEYMKNDQLKQQQIKNLTNQNERMKTDLSKKDKQMNGILKKAEQLRQYQKAYQQCTSLLESIKIQKKNLSTELDNYKQKYITQKRKLLEQNDNLMKEIQKLNDKMEKQTSQYKLIQGSLKDYQNKCNRYEQDIMMRTDKLKQKNKQIKVFTDQIQKMNERVEELSRLTNHLIQENETLKQNVSNLEAKNEHFKQFYNQLSKVKLQLNTKKHSQMAKLTESLQKLGKMNYI